MAVQSARTLFFYNSCHHIKIDIFPHRFYNIDIFV